ncbi:hypothetical protein PFISCL1PPCAC_17711, partial [Pristionchus fissidentatus]
QIVPPGFPHPRNPCEYMLIVEAKSLVQLEILSFELNPNIDFLEIYEGTSGKNLLANLTGTSLPVPNKYMTKSSNVMRVNWKPNYQFVNYRGFRKPTDSIHRDRYRKVTLSTHSVFLSLHISLSHSIV